MKNEKPILSKDELKFIDQFCQKKDIHYLDLRIEMVDHLAELTTEKMAADDNLSFKDAFFLVYKSYGIFGFMDVAAAHESTMQKRYWREVWQFVKNWITPPKVFLTAGLAALMYFLAEAISPDNRQYLFVICFLILVASAIKTYQQMKQNKKALNGHQTVLMSGYKSGFYVFFYFVNYAPFIQFTKEGFVTTFLNSPGVLTALFMVNLLFAVANFLIQKKATQQIETLKLSLI